MMRKKKIIVASIIIVLAILAASYYWMLANNPKPFPKTDAILQELHSYEVRELLDIKQVDPKHVYVPFVSKGGDYGYSMWEWKQLRWSIQYLDTKGEPLVWKLRETDPSSYMMIWNLNPKDRMSEIRYYLQRERYYSEGDEGSMYQPRIQLEWKVDLREHSYGAEPLPQQWVHILENENNLVPRQKAFSLFSSIMGPSPIAYGWTPLNENGEWIFPEYSVNGSSTSFSDISLQMVRILDEKDLE
ncbi:hypothetical protein [Paenibacillus sp. 1001270B_150601_E10]|uniref:hypothetical protein n=1 Tax=Paenibacillus sp. 1001270B_150601_E10 TaxID=2787079 RepID=UPI00189CD520|nr:hypothetical protein [Paenibacillus sp. 1001270B_150601_E10]